MKKIEALAKGLLKNFQVDSKLKRIEMALKAARLNINDAKAQAEFELDELTKQLATQPGVESTTQAICDKIAFIEKQDKGLDRLNKAEKHIYKEVEVDND